MKPLDVVGVASMRRKVLTVAVAVMLATACVICFRYQSREGRLQRIRQAGWVYDVGRHPDYGSFHISIPMSQRTLIFGEYYGSYVGIHLRSAQASEDLIVDSLDVGHVVEMDLTGSRLTDASLIRICTAPSAQELQKLLLSGTAITDHGLQEAAKLPMLVRIRVRGTRVTKAGIDAFKAVSTAAIESDYD